MKKLKRTSYFDSNRTSYLDAEKQEYVYEFISYDEKGRPVPARQIIAITKDNIEIIKMLDGFDHEEDLQLLYERRHKEKYLDYDNDDNGSGEANRETGIANIPDKKHTIDRLLFESEEVDDGRYDEFMSTLTNDQANLIYDHIGLGKTFVQIGREMKVPVTALESRWKKIKNRAKKFFNL